MNTVIELKRLEKSIEEIRNTDPQSLATMEVGDEWRQGDLRIIRLSDDFGETNAKDIKPAKPQQQLAPGTTQGSRHCLSNLEGVEFFVLVKATPLDGPVIRTGANSITHPEHGDCVDLPAGWYAFPGQRAYADELRRVAD